MSDPLPGAGRDSGGIVLGWLLRISLALLVLGVLVFDVFSLAYTNVTTVDDAGIVAGVAADRLISDPGKYDKARLESLSEASELGVRMKTKDFWVDQEGEVHVTVSRQANTLVLHYVKPLRKYLTVRAVGTAASK